MHIASNFLEEAIANKNVVRIRSIFTVIAHEDPSFKTGKFFKMLEYVESKNIPGIFVPYDGKPFKPKNEWDEEYWSLIVSSLMDNFSKERISHLKQISEFLFVDKENNKANHNENNCTAHTDTESIRRQKHYREEQGTKKAIPITVTAGLAITCVAAIVVGAKWIAATAGTAAVAMGIYTAIKD